jgi:hypothetical protein
MLENPDHNLLLLLLVIACIVVILLLLVAFVGAYRLLLASTAGNGIGVIVYIVLWIFFFPVMLIISLVLGGIWLVVYSWASWGDGWDGYWRDFWA